MMGGFRGFPIFCGKLDFVFCPHSAHPVITDIAFRTRHRSLH